MSGIRDVVVRAGHPLWVWRRWFQKKVWQQISSYQTLPPILHQEYVTIFIKNIWNLNDTEQPIVSETDLIASFHKYQLQELGNFHSR